MTLPLWGMCRHGLVTGGQLALENGDTFAHPQPGAINTGGVSGTTRDFMHEVYGHTLQVKVPGVAEITRTPEQAADDYEKGYVWQNSATMAGGTKFMGGRAIASGVNGWIYCAPDGSRWRVRLIGINPATAYDRLVTLSFTVRLNRFGDIGVAPEQHDYLMTLSDFGIDTVDSLIWRQIYLLITDCKPDGSRAVMEAARFSSYTGSLPQASTTSMEQRFVAAFHEFTFSGTPGVDFVPALSILYKTSDMFVVTGGFNDMIVNEWSSGWVYAYDDTTPLEEPWWFSAPERPPETFGFLVDFAPSFVLNRSSAETRAERIAAVWYDSLGLPVPLKIIDTAELTYAISSPDAQFQTSSSAWTCSVWMEWGEYSSEVHTDTGSSSGSWSWPEWVSGETYDWESTYIQNRAACGLAADTGPALVIPASNAVIPSRVSGFGVGVGYGAFARYTPARFSNNVIGLCSQAGLTRVSTSQRRALFAPMTKSGEAAGGPVIDDGVPYPSAIIRYGSYNPATGETAWGGTVPTCYV